MTIDQVKVIEIGADAIEEALQAQPYLAAYPPKMMHVVVAALGRHGYIIEDRYEEEAGPVPLPESSFIEDGAPYFLPQKPFRVDGDDDICDDNGWLVFCTAKDIWEDRKALADILCAEMNKADAEERTTPDWETSGDDA